MYVALGLNDDFAYIIKAAFLSITWLHYFYIKTCVFEIIIWSHVIIAIKLSAIKIKNGIKLVCVWSFGENEVSIKESVPCCSAALALI
jgi:hypothetical protein